MAVAILSFLAASSPPLHTRLAHELPHNLRAAGSTMHTSERGSSDGAVAPNRSQRAAPRLDAEEAHRLRTMKLDVVFLNEDYVCVNKPHGVRIDGDFDTTVEKLLQRQLPDVEKFRLIHQLDFGECFVRCTAAAVVPYP